MIYITKNTANTVILELTLISSYINPSYLFEFINDIQPQKITLFTGADLSTIKTRYNQFNIIESGYTYSNLTASTVNLISGSYTYNIYEASGVTLSISATTGSIISTGKVVVVGIDTELAEVYR